MVMIVLCRSIVFVSLTCSGCIGDIYILLDDCLDIPGLLSYKGPYMYIYSYCYACTTH